MTELDYKAMGFWLDVLQWLSIGVVAVWGYLRTKDADNARAVKAVTENLAAFVKECTVANAAQNIRLTKLEERMDHMPTDEDIANLAGEVATLKAQVTGVAALLERVEHQTQMIHQHLLSK